LVKDSISESAITTVTVTSKSPDIDAVVAAIMSEADSVMYGVGR